MAKTRTIPCPDCTGKQYVNLFKKNSKDLGALFGSVGSSLRLVLENASILSKSSNRLKDKKSLFKNGCPTCRGKGTIEDKTDQSQQIQAASQKAQQLQKEITQLEADLGGAGPGGNRHTLVVGDDMLEVGLGYNDTPSYKVVKDGSLDPGGAQIEEEAVMKVSTKTNAVIGTNPLSTPGGHYTIKCSNKFIVRAGTQGIELNTEGPLIIRAGQTQLIGPEVTVGSSVGRVVIEGKSTSIGGDSISLNPGTGGKGQVSCTGTFTTVGNMIAQGGAHFEGDVSCISMTMPGKVERSKHASQDIQTSGSATWSTQCAQQALQDFVRIRTIRAQDPAGLVLSPREQQNVTADQKNLVKKRGVPSSGGALVDGVEPTGYIVPGTQFIIDLTSITGILDGEGKPCSVAGIAKLIGTFSGPGKGVELRNLPHHHSLGDMIHAHDSTVPNIKLTNGCKSVRATAKGKEAPAPVMANTGDPSSNIFTQAFQLIQSVVAKRIT
jgi:hypothetical protein